MAYFSTSSSDYASAINSLTKPTYTSKYNSLIEETMNKILNKEDFSYDFNADPLYQNYKDQYTKLGKEAAMNAASSASALTGGYGNSYAGTAASQANQQYLTQLNNIIPELYDAALNKYQMETENLYNQFGMLETEENRQYGQYRDSVSDYYSDWSNLQNGYSTALAQENWEAEMAYQKERDAVSDSQWEKSFNNSNSQWAAEMAYQQSRDAVSDSQWEKEYQMALESAKKNSSSGSSSGSRSSSSSSSSSSSKSSSSGYPTDYLNTIRSMAEKNLSSGSSSDTVDEYLSKEVQAGRLSESDAQKLYLQLITENTKYGTKYSMGF